MMQTETLPNVKLSHADKVMWPATERTRAFTKLDLARYYLMAADRMLPHIVHRPISIVRAPDGIEGQQFFQRHVGKGEHYVLPIKVSGEPKPYLGIAGAEGLAELAQAAGLEIHPWGSKANAPDTPERIIFDMDPAPDVDFSRVMAAARDVRERLQACGLEPFLKTTGGKGLHVVVAVKGSRTKPVTWDGVKTFARDLCTKMAADEPDKYVAVLSKKARTGRIFLDYLRNDRTSTAVAPWSPRARPGAPIAVPIEWSQLRGGLDPKAYNIATADKVLKRADAWKGLAASAGSLASAQSRLSKL
jgi:bifunctional non-homologous end joining protein LigD